MQKLSVERAELKNGVFTCECWIGGEETTERQVLFDELVKFMNGKDGIIPVNDDDRETDEYELPLLEWIDINGHAALCDVLFDLINKKGRPHRICRFNDERRGHFTSITTNSYS